MKAGDNMSVLAVDIGGTSIKYAEMGENDLFLTHGSVPTPQTGREALVEAIGRLYDAAPECRGIAISMPGIIDSENGYVVMGGALRYNDDFFFRQALQERCPVPVYLENDAKCAALAEAANGALQDVSNGMVLIFGTMIGGALIMNHHLYKGSHFAAGEISYLITDRNGSPSMDGVFGNRCGVPRLCSLYAQAIGVPPESMDGVKFFCDVNHGVPEAALILRQYADEIAVQIFNFQNLYDPDRFAIGGGISVQPAFIDAIRDQLGALYAVCPYPVRQAEITVCRYQNDANLYGAYRCFMERIGHY